MKGRKSFFQYRWFFVFGSFIFRFLGGKVNSIFASVVIEDDVWIGCGVRILSGVKISERSVVAAGAVVNKQFERRSLIGGVPAKLIKKLNE